MLLNGPIGANISSIFQDIGQQSHRRKWDKDEYERRARDREDEERGEAKKKRDDKAKKGA